MHLIIFSTLLAGTLAAPMIQSLNVNDDGTYQFFYETGKDAGNHKRSEARQSDGVVVGKFSYEDPNGDIREVNYRADDAGYIANGDVSVEGAPKGQFPAVPEETNEAALPSAPQNENPEPQAFPVEEAKAEEVAPKSDVSSDEEKSEPLHEEESKHEDLKELPSEENTADGPPEAFPPGFFLEKFHGLRRLPEPTKEDEPTSKEVTSETPKEESASTEQPKPADQASEQPGQAVPTANVDPYQANLKAAHEMELFMHLRPFQSFSPQQMDTSMFRQPVYVFSYQHPDSYGYHYFF